MTEESSRSHLPRAPDPGGPGSDGPAAGPPLSTFSAEVARARPGFPARIGGYQIRRILGEGGMGRVYEARQENPSRAVALKVIRAGYLSPELLRRFDQESQVLGRLQHPGIAQIHEAGTVEDEAGLPLPYFAMEFIRGVPLTEFAATRGLGARERLELLARVCDAVAHAHQKGVIHRDLKPGNILVDESGQPKILDFGVARATDSDVQQATLRTDVGQLLGTLPYMSPEQVSGDPADLDTRSDVYALGVIAYELLAGRLPYDLGKRMITEAARVIREVEPASLSGIDRTLKGDIETIVGKALEKDKTRRYSSAEALATDIRRFLRDEPISARPASTWYQMRKFSRRNRGLVVGVGAAFVLLLAGVVATGLALRRALRAEAGLKGQLAETENARAASQSRAEELKQVSEFQAGMLGQVDVTQAGARLMKDVRERFAQALAKSGLPPDEIETRRAKLEGDLGAVNATDAAANLIDTTILRPAIAAIEAKFHDQPLVDASLRQSLADLYEKLGRYDQAEPLQERALATRKRVLGDEHPDTLASQHARGVLLQAQGKLAEAEAAFRDDLAKRARVLGDEHKDTLLSTNDLGFVLQSQGKLEEAHQILEKVLVIRRRAQGDRDADTLGALNNMGIQLQAEGKLPESQAYYEEALAGYRRVLGDENKDTLSCMNNLGTILWSQGNLAGAEPFWREALEKRRRVLGEEHPDTLAGINNLATLLFTQGKKTEAEPYFREALETSRRILGDDHPTTVQMTNNLGAVLLGEGRRTEAEPFFRQALETRRRLLGEDHQDTLVSMNNLGSLLRDLGRLEEALTLAADAVEHARRTLGAEHWYTATFLGQLARTLAAQKRFREAEAPALESLKNFEGAFGSKHERTRGAIQILIDLYREWDEAEPGSGYGAKSAEWKAKLDATAAPAPASER